MRLMKLGLATISSLTAFSFSCKAIIFHDDEDLVPSKTHPPRNHYRVLSANGQDVLMSVCVSPRPMSYNEGAAVIFHDQRGRRLGLTAAHNLPRNTENQFYIDMGDPKDPLTLDRARVTRRFQMAPSYNSQSEKIEKYSHDLAVFTTGANELRSEPLPLFRRSCGRESLFNQVGKLW